MSWQTPRHNKLCGRLLAGLLSVILLLSSGPSALAWTAAGQAFVQNVLADAAGVAEPGPRTVRISEHFLARPYRAGTLGGGPDQTEQLVIDFDGVDCFTLLDYVEALRRCATAEEFPANLRSVRYRNGEVTWAQRRHFFTDWAQDPGNGVRDVTAEVGGDRTQQVIKQLNRREDGSLYLPGVAVQQRTVHYIPVPAIDIEMVERLQAGDYLGIYSNAPGLDVSHTGIVVRREGQLFLRHASSQPGQNRVIDSPLACYLTGKPGLVVLRAE